MSAWDSYSFTCPLTSDCKPTRYLSVLSLLDREGPTSKRTILDKVWHVKNAYDPYMWRGHMSTMFAAMHRKGIASYDRYSQRWSITEKGKRILENAKAAWGRKFADKYWN